MKCIYSKFFVLLLLAVPMVVNAQSCTSATCNAASPSESDFLAALPSSSNTNATVVVNIPAGSSTWTTGFKYTIPSAITSLTIQGASGITFSGTAGQSNYAATPSDKTTITDGWSSYTSLMNFVTQGTSQYFRVTGLTINLGSTGYSKYGELLLDGNSSKFRMDHVHFVSSTNAGAAIRVEGQVYGLLDHNVTSFGTNTNLTNGFQVFSGNDTIGLGDGEFAQPTPWGTGQAVYIEANIFNGGSSNDCYQGGYFVERYNTINDSYVGIQTHGTKSTGGPYRACRGYEAYHNYFSATASPSPASGSTGAKGATALIWGNLTSQTAAYRFFEAAGDRNSGDEDETNTPNGWGYCGSGVNGNGVGSPWDGNQPSVSVGYPCLDGLGRGQSQALNGQPFPSRKISSTGAIAWPKQFLEPIYMWENSIGSATYVLIQDSVTDNNRDYYYDCGSGNSSCSGAFTGEAGTGFGSLANRPSTCAAGPGGTYATSPTGSYGVAYFATDANGGKGELYVCTSTNTWTGIYQPYTYPHPLESGSSSTPPPASPAAPTNLTGVVH